MHSQPGGHQQTASRFFLSQYCPTDTAANMARDVRMGLTSAPKYLQAKYFYDERGSWLYDRICEVPEYYPARTETALLIDKAPAIIELVRPDSIVELGSGTSRKTVHVLDACERQACYVQYLPLDVCREMLMDAGQRLLEHYPWLTIHALVDDYSEGFGNIPMTPGTRLYLFLGGTIGNLDEAASIQFLKALVRIMRKGDNLLLGVDRIKDRDVLQAAYNDAQGYTAEFNRNILQVINRGLGGQFVPETFEHQAWFNESKSQIEMHLHSHKSQQVYVENINMDINFVKDESIHTEISRKFSPESLNDMVSAAGLTILEHFEPDNGYFSLVLLGRT